MKFKYYQLIKVVLLSFFVALQSLQSFAELPERLIYNMSNITPSVAFEGEKVPTSFKKSNNLAITTGNYYFAEGEPLVVEGVITDINDIPIQGVSVNMWQTNAKGFYQFNRSEEDPLVDNNFNDTGGVVTDSLGRFQFLTIVPAGYSQDPSDLQDDLADGDEGKEVKKVKTKSIKAKRKRSPHINFIIKHGSFKTLETQMFFSIYSNAEDYYFSKLQKKDRELLTAKMYYIDSRDKDIGKRAVFNIKLDGVQRFKYY
jgi:protocatechuate 3,4-dioxygenase beta subunit